MRQYATVGTSELATAIDSIDTEITVATGHGVRFDPSPAGVALSASDPLVLTLLATPDDPNFEVVYVTAPRSTDTFPTIVRAREGTTARDWPVGTLVQAGLTGVGMDEIAGGLSLFGLVRQPVQAYIPGGGGLNTIGINYGFSSDGTMTGRSVTTTSYFTRQQRVGTVSAATAGSSVATRGTAGILLRSDGAGNGGFRHISRWGIADAAAVADGRMFAGVITQISSIGNFNPSAIANLIGVGCDNGQTTLRVIHNDGSGTATTIDLGANFPTDTRSTDWYELELRSDPWDAGVRYWVRRLNTGHVATGTITTDLPATTTILTSQVWRNNGATALAVAMDIGGIVHGVRA